MTNRLIEEIEKLGTLPDNWPALRDILKTIVNQIPQLAFEEKEEKEEELDALSKRKKKK